jgi:primosomal protein N' (replication factor Y)
MTFHKKSARFHCHYCERTLPPLSSCPECQGVHIAYLGRGTEKIEEELQHLFPEARISRMDRDTTGRKFSYDRILGGMREGTIDILIGTQMVTKGHDLPNVTLVGVICADTILNFPDFRAAERTFQILTQVSGRAGRGEQEGEVIIQTYNPDHYSLVHAAAQDFPGFYQQEMKFRKELGYPPFTRLVTFLFSGRNESKVEAKAAEWVREIGLRKDPSIEILGPAPAPFVKIKGRYRWRCLIKGGDARKIGELTRKIAASWHAGKKEGVELEIDVDPQNLL